MRQERPGNQLRLAPRDSVSHQHIATIVNTLLDGLPRTQLVRILDVGCGDGRLLGHTLRSLSALRSTLRVEAFGLDVSDAGQQERGYFDQTRLYLESEHSGVDWKQKLALIRTRDDWPYPDGSFDFITSNQVLEHVSDHDFVFRQVRRCLRPSGISVNVFPLRNVLWEGHACMPLVHRVRDVDARARLILLFARMGFRRHYHREKRRRGWESLEEFARAFAQVLETDTNYLTAKQVRSAAEGADLEVSFAYTKDLFFAKALSYLDRRPSRYRELGPLESVGFFFGKYLASATVLLRRR